MNKFEKYLKKELKNIETPKNIDITTWEHIKLYKTEIDNSILPKVRFKIFSKIIAGIIIGGTIIGGITINLRKNYTDNDILMPQEEQITIIHYREIYKPENDKKVQNKEKIIDKTTKKQNKNIVVIEIDKTVIDTIK